MPVETPLKYESRRFQPEAWQVCQCSAALLFVCERSRSPAIAGTTLPVGSVVLKTIAVSTYLPRRSR